jgi:hypothetical protein
MGAPRIASYQWTTLWMIYTITTKVYFEVLNGLDLYKITLHEPYLKSFVWTVYPYCMHLIVWHISKMFKQDIIIIGSITCKTSPNEAWDQVDLISVDFHKEWFISRDVNSFLDIGAHPVSWGWNHYVMSWLYIYPSYVPLNRKQEHI